jgi:hypothetical protein
MYDVLTGKQRALVFPVMCNGFVKIDYSDNVPDSADDIGYGIWSHSGDFTFEAIVTPYDINGASDLELDGRTLTASKKIMPNNVNESTLTNYQSNLYLSGSNRVSHEMRIFSSTHFYISLKNGTVRTHNQPAEYHILVGIKLSSGAVQEFITTSPVILPTNTRSWAYSSIGELTATGLNEEGRVEYELCTAIDNSSNSGTAFSSGDNVLPVTDFSSDANAPAQRGQELFVRNGFTYTSIGTVSSVAHGPDTLTLFANYVGDLPNTTQIFKRTYLDPTYVENSFHIACTYDETAKNLNIYLNGLLVKTGTHAQSGTFSFEDEDLFIGATGGGATGVDSAATNKQFMGEMHEMCLTSVIRRRFPSINSLHPNYNDTLFYFRFEEVDL